LKKILYESIRLDADDDILFVDKIYPNATMGSLITKWIKIP